MAINLTVSGFQVRRSLSRAGENSLPRKEIVVLWRYEVEVMIIYAKPAVKAISHMDVTTKQRIKAAIEKLPAGDIKKLSGYSCAYRLRVGDWRVLFDMQEDIIITNILPRGDAYKK